MKWTLIFVAKWMLLAAVLMAFCGCDIPVSERDELKADALRDSARIVIVLGFKDQPQRKIQIGIAAKHVLALLEAEDMNLQNRHWNGLLSKINRPEFQQVSKNLLALLSACVREPAGSGFRRLNKRHIVFMRAFFNGVLEGSVCK